MRDLDHSFTGAVTVLLERISGQSIDRFLKERIFEPLGMADTFYNAPREKVDRAAGVYRRTRDGMELLRAPSFQEPTTYFRAWPG